MYKGKNILPSEFVPGVEYYAQQGSAIVGRFRSGDVLPVGATFYEIEHNWVRGDPIPPALRSVLLHDHDLVEVVVHSENGIGSGVGSVGSFRSFIRDLFSKTIDVYRIHINVGSLHQNVGTPRMGGAVVEEPAEGFKF